MRMRIATWERGYTFKGKFYRSKRQAWKQWKPGDELPRKTKTNRLKWRTLPDL